MSSQKQSKSRKGLSVICRILGILFLLAVIVTALPITIPKLMGYQIFHVESGSMEPALPVGSVIYVKQVSPEEVAEGDIITFRREDATVTHRVVENRLVEGEFITKGDANEEADLQPVPYESLIGRVTRHFPVLGKFLAVYASRLGKAYVFLVAACGVMLNILGSLLRKS